MLALARASRRNSGPRSGDRGYGIPEGIMFSFRMIAHFGLPPARWPYAIRLATFHEQAMEPIAARSRLLHIQSDEDGVVHQTRPQA